MHERRKQPPFLTDAPGNLPQLSALALLDGLSTPTLGIESQGDIASALQLSGEVRFRREGNLLCVDHATPVMWFARHVLERSREAPDVGLSFDGTHVTLHASNGRWVWRLTGRIWCRSHASGAEPLVMAEGIWPD